MTAKDYNGENTYFIDNLQYANYSPTLFDEMAAAGLSAVHVTICYHENFRQTVENIITWNRHIAIKQVDVWTAADVMRTVLDGQRFSTALLNGR